LAAALGSKLCAAAVDLGLCEHFERLKVQYSARLIELRAIDGTEDCAVFVAKQLQVVEEKSRLYALDVDKIAGVFGMLLAPRIQEPYSHHHMQQGQKPLIHFIGGLRKDSNLSLLLDHRPDLQDQIRPVLTEIMAEVARILPSTAIEAGDLNLAFNTVTLNHLCHLGNAALLFTRDADEELKVKSSLLKAAVMAPGEPSIETKKLAKDVTTASTEKKFLARLVEAFEEVERALRAAGRMS
jgi:hypothetical protein